MKPSWSDAPDWAKCLAQDSTGNWYWYEEKPVQHKTCWKQSFGQFKYAGRSKASGWAQSLEKRA